MASSVDSKPELQNGICSYDVHADTVVMLTLDFDLVLFPSLRYVVRAGSRVPLMTDLAK